VRLVLGEVLAWALLVLELVVVMVLVSVEMLEEVLV